MYLQRTSSVQTQGILSCGEIFFSRRLEEGAAYAMKMPRRFLVCGVYAASTACCCIPSTAAEVSSLSATLHGYIIASKRFKCLSLELVCPLLDFRSHVLFNERFIQYESQRAGDHIQGYPALSTMLLQAAQVSPSQQPHEGGVQEEEADWALLCSARSASFMHTSAPAECVLERCLPVDLFLQQQLCASLWS
eukprot:TRINITY_DN24208_c0_g1_i1.p1 TRINITY_DN24208_c0_g1~~TRINITY_DN24208_c0_g1_i1.p1  ORF type:complete len:192 (-),score=27.79 TRINITY_DN24208_c0_g1_i1:465-1040(-)